MAKATPEQINLLDQKPVRNLEWEQEDGGIVVLLVPKFRTGLFAKWLQPRLPKPVIKVKLDTYGSYVWTSIDGKATVFEISEKMKVQFGENFDPDYRRIGSFVNQLIRDKFVRISNDSITNS